MYLGPHLLSVFRNNYYIMEKTIHRYKNTKHRLVKLRNVSSVVKINWVVNMNFGAPSKYPMHKISLVQNIPR